MTATVRVFGLSGLVAAPLRGTSFTTDSVQMARYPVLGRDLLTCDAGNADTSETTAAPDGTTILMVQVQTGKTVYFEVIPPSESVTDANTTSPTMSGQTLLSWGPGWRISVLEAS